MISFARGSSPACGMFSGSDSAEMGFRLFSRSVHPRVSSSFAVRGEA
jgi:hypothetical protein